MDLKEKTLDELLTLRQNAKTIEEYRIIDSEISVRYKRWEKSKES